MGEVSGSSTLNTNRGSTTYGSENNSQGSYDKYATFAPQASATLNSLAQAYGGTGTAATDVSKYYQNVLAGDTVNPYYQQLAAAQGKQADASYAQNLASVRSGNYGGGAGSDFIDQSKLAANFANQKAANEATLLAQAYQQGEASKQAAASGLTSQQQNALNFLSLLRGESGTANSSTTTTGRQFQKSTGTSNSLAGKFGIG